MPRVFIDTFYFFALGNRHDLSHPNALAFGQSYSGQLVTTDFVPVEFAHGCAGTERRRLAGFKQYAI